jgi:hypothetical protein
MSQKTKTKTKVKKKGKMKSIKNRKGGQYNKKKKKVIMGCFVLSMGYHGLVFAEAQPQSLINMYSKP